MLLVLHFILFIFSLKNCAFTKQTFTTQIQGFGFVLTLRGGRTSLNVITPLRCVASAGIINTVISPFCKFINVEEFYTQVFFVSIFNTVHFPDQYGNDSNAQTYEELISSCVPVYTVGLDSIADIEENRFRIALTRRHPDELSFPVSSRGVFFFPSLPNVYIFVKRHCDDVHCFKALYKTKVNRVEYFPCS